MIRNLEDKMSREEDEARREARMDEYRRRVRHRFEIFGPTWSPSGNVETAVQPRCDVFRVDTTWRGE